MAGIFLYQSFRAFFEDVALALNFNQQTELIALRGFYRPPAVPFAHTEGLHDLVQIKQDFWPIPSRFQFILRHGLFTFPLADPGVCPTHSRSHRNSLISGSRALPG